jgi:hypothetical protein
MTHDDTPAFPAMGDPERDTFIQGMTLRDYMAGQALIGILCSEGVRQSSEEIIALYSYKQADAMMKARQG